jgi:CBS-domain-containing membrane protein
LIGCDNNNNVIDILLVLRKGKIVGTISLSDIPFGINSLLDSCGAFVEGGKGRNVPISHDVACVEPDTTFASLLKGFSVSQFHRLWVMDGEELLGVISLSDVLHTLLAFATEDVGSKGKKKSKKSKAKSKKTKSKK